MRNDSIEITGWTLLNFIWQGFAAAGLLAALLWLLRRSTAQSRYFAACGVFALMAAAPLLTSWWLSAQTRGIQQSSESVPRRVGRVIETHQPVPIDAVGLDDLTHPTEQLLDLGPASPPVVADAASVSSQTQPASATLTDSTASRFDRVRQFLDRQLLWIVGFWLLGVGALSVRLLTGWLGVQRLRRQATRPLRADWQTSLQCLAERLRVTRPVKLVESALIEVPAVIGWLRPIILLPTTAMTGLTSEQLEALLAHELAHVRRHDYLINLLQTVVETLLFYHPAVWWISHRIRLEREHCCDDLAVSACGNRLGYMRALVAMEELRGPRFGLILGADDGSLRDRVERLATLPSSPVRRSSPQVAGVVGLLVAASVIGMTFLQVLSSSATIANEDPFQRERAYLKGVRFTPAKLAPQRRHAPGLVCGDVWREVEGHDEFLVSEWTNSGDAPLLLTDSDFSIVVANASRVFPPKSERQTGVTLAPQETRLFRLNWHRYVRDGLWTRRENEVIRESTFPDPPSDEFVTVRLDVANIGAGYAALTAPARILSGQGTAPGNGLLAPPNNRKQKFQISIFKSEIAEIGLPDDRQLTATKSSDTNEETSGPTHPRGQETRAERQSNEADDELFVTIEIGQTVTFEFEQSIKTVEGFDSKMLTVTMPSQTTARVKASIAGLTIVTVTDSEGTEFAIPIEVLPNSNTESSKLATTTIRPKPRTNPLLRPVLIGGNNLPVVLGVQQPRFLRFAERILRVSGFDPLIINVCAVSPHQIRVTGLAIGRTSFTVSTEKEGEEHKVEIEVTHLKLSRESIRKHFAANDGDLPADQRPNPAPESGDPRRAQVIERGVTFLKAQQQESGAWQGNPVDGVSALTAAALLQAGVKADDPVMQKALTHLRKVEPAQTYVVALQTMVFCAATPKEDAEFIRRNVVWIEKAQVAVGKARGAWSYAANPGGRGDGSCSRFAVLGLHAAKRAGFDVQAETWQRVSDYWLTTQHQTGAWGYVPGAKPTPTMTLAGVACLATANRYLPQGEPSKVREEAIRRPAEYLELVIPDLQTGTFAFYALHSLERAGHVSGIPQFGKLDWKGDMTKRLLDLQLPNGSWSGRNSSAAESELIATSLALLALTGEPERGNLPEEKPKNN